MLPPTDLPTVDHTTECNCDVHKTIRRWEQMINPKTDEQRQAFHEMLEAWEDAETDLAYYRAVLEGSWPSSEKLLTKALEKVRAKKNE